MCDLLGEVIVILITIWWLQTFGQIGSMQTGSTEVWSGKIQSQETKWAGG